MCRWLHLVGHGVGEAVPAAPVTAAHGHDGHLGDDDGTADGGSHLEVSKAKHTKKNAKRVNQVTHSKQAHKISRWR